MLEAEHATTYF